jgi:hypothetical protein
MKLKKTNLINRRLSDRPVAAEITGKWLLSSVHPGQNFETKI